MSEFQIVSIDQVVESPSNPRRRFSEEGMKELADSIRAKGIINPLLVRPVDGHYEIIAGARRFRAARAAELQELPVLIREIGDAEALELQVLENLQREDVHPLEEAIGYQALLAQPGYDIAGVAAKIGKSESYVYQRLKLADLIQPAQEKFLDEKITAGHAILIARLQPADQEKALEECFTDEWGYKTARRNLELISCRKLADWIQSEIHLDLHAAPFSKSDPDLVPGVGTCKECPKRTGFIPALFPDIAKKDTCTDRACYKAKLEAHIAAVTTKAEKSGEELLQVSSDWAQRGKKQDGLMHRGQYCEIEDKKDRCKSSQRAIVVEGSLNRGKVIEVCTDKDCKKHHQHQTVEGGNWEKEQKEKEQKAKQEIAYRVRLLTEILARAPDALEREDQELIVRRLINTCQDDQKIVKRHGWPVIPGEFGIKDFKASIAGQFPSLTNHELFCLALELSLYGETQVSAYQLDSKPKLLLATAERYGIDPKAVKKAASFESDQKQNAKTKKAKAETEPSESETKASKGGTKSRKKETKAKKNKPVPAGPDDPACEVCGCTEMRACPGGCQWDGEMLRQGRHICSRCV